MKKLLVLAMMAMLLVAGSAFAAGRNLTAQANATPGSGAAGFASSGPTTTNNDDSCDIGTAPAATLLLPWFEVDIAASAATARTTLFTITNTSFLPQIAHVTVWTDWSFPVFDFNIFLTGYDVQAINLYDVIARGIIAPGTTAGTSITTVPANNTLTAPSAQPEQFNDNPNHSINVSANCAGLPGAIPPQLLADIRALLTTGRTTGAVITACSTVNVGSTSTLAHGYVTIDVTSTCSTSLPTDAGYFTGEVLFDNVFIGDYQEVSPNATTGNFAGGSPLVHIRATPEGGAAGSIPTGVTNLPYTFYDRYQTGVERRLDRRQPLPSTFGARWISGGTGAFNTDYKIWREGLTGSTPACADYNLRNRSMPIAQVIRFDERENATSNASGIIISPPIVTTPVLPEASRTAVSNTVFPPLSASGDVGGWMYLNLSNGGAFGAVNPYSQARSVPNNVPPSPFAGPATSTLAAGVRQSQNWAIVSMAAEGRYAVDFDAAWLGNGCGISPSTGTQVGPTGGVLVCPPGAACNAPDPLTTPPTGLGTNQTP